jgi:FMNH2-dependent dimethyl sulfone monooxygenase
MPLRRAEQRVGITQGPFDPGGQPLLQSENPFYLGLSGWDVAGGSSITKAVLGDRDKHWGYFSWPNCADLATEAERVGLEVLLADGGQRGFGGEIEFHDAHLDALTSIAALSQVTSRIVLASTVGIASHLHPLHIARFGGNFDHMSGGRWALNIATRPDREEEESLGLDPGESDKRYDVADEFVTLMKHWWSMQTAFEFKGKYFQSRHVHMVGPRPTRKPRPFLLTTAYDRGGIDFAAKHCDWLLCRNISGDVEELSEMTRQARLRAAHHYSRDLKTLVHVYVVMAEREETALREFERLASMIDVEATDNFIRRRVLNDAERESDEGLLGTRIKGRTWEGGSIRQFVGEDTYTRLALGLGSVQIVGGYDTVAARLRDLATSGHQGAILSFFDPLRGLHELEDEIIPRLRSVGLRS